MQTWSTVTPIEMCYLSSSYTKEFATKTVAGIKPLLKGNTSYITNTSHKLIH